MIESQFNLDDTVGSYGACGSLNRDGSGAVAIKNICEMYEHTKNITLEEIIKKYRLGRGIFGTNPLKIRRALRKLGFEVKFKLYATTRNMRGYHTYILLFYRHGDKFYDGWHYTAGKQNSLGQMKTYNLLHFYKNIAQFKQFEKPIFPMIFLIR